MERYKYYNCIISLLRKYINDTSTNTFVKKTNNTSFKL